MTTVSVIGLGIMGLPMAVNLVKAGFDVIGYNRSPEKVARFVEAGGRAASTLAEAVAAADVVITVLPDSPDVESVVDGEDGILAHASTGTIWIDCSTIRPGVSVELAAASKAAGLRPLDAPVSGGEQGAIAGTLSIMVGGERETFDLAHPVLERIGSTIVYVGGAGSGQTVKAANQLIVAGNLALLAEALVFLEAHEVDVSAAIAVLSGGFAGSRVLEAKASTMAARSFEPGFRVDLHHKDLGIVLDAARQRSVAIPLTAVAAQLMGAVRARGGGQLDHSALFLLVEELSGRGQ